MPSLAHIANGELGLSVRNKLNSLIDQYNVPIAFPPGGGVQGSVLFIDGTGAIAQDNAKFFWDDTADILKLLGSLTTASVQFNGATSGAVTLQAQAIAGSWTMKLPATSGTNLYVLQTDGTGVTSWVPQSGGGGGGMAIGGAITSATLGSVLFAGAAGVLAQDNANFFWDDTNFNLKLNASGTGQGILQMAGQNAIFRVPNVSGDNWFEGGAGNLSVTGSGNFGTGTNALNAVTTGSGNVAIGISSCGKVNSGTANLGIGGNSLQLCTTGSDNTAIGSGALQNLQTSTQNTALGAGSLAQITTGGSNICVGSSSLTLGQIINNNVAIGVGVLNLLGASGTAEANNVGIGTSVCGSANSGFNNNVVIGAIVAPNISSGNNNIIMGIVSLQSASGANSSNVVLGATAVRFATSVNQCTVLGTWPGPSAALSNIIAFADGSSPASPQLDWNYTNNNTWSMSVATTAQGLHVYNTSDSGTPPTNYERVCLDWKLTSNVARLASQAGGTGTKRLIAIDGFQKAGAPAAGDLPSGTCALINDTSGGNTWLVYNNSGAIRKVQLV